MTDFHVSNKHKQQTQTSYRKTNNTTINRKTEAYKVWIVSYFVEKREISL